MASSEPIISMFHGLLCIRTPYTAANAQACAKIPDFRKWDNKERCWVAKPTPRNLEYLKTVLPDAFWTDEATALFTERVVARAEQNIAFAAQKTASLDVLAKGDDWKHGGPAPWDHQRRAFLMGRDRKAFAYFMEQRTGKSKVLIDDLGWNYTRGRVFQALIVSPNTVKTVWSDEQIPLHMPSYIPTQVATWTSSPTVAQERQITAVLKRCDDHLNILVMNIEALSTPRGLAVAMKFVKQAPTFMAIDESPRIKTPGAARSTAAVALGKECPVRRILTGTPAAQSPMDLYQQMKFLDPNILGFGSFYAFRNHFAIMGGFEGKEIVAYANLDELQQLLDPHSFRVTRDECLDIPPKGYQKLVVDLTPEQQKHYTRMKKEFLTTLDDQGVVTATIVLTQMLRCAQITSGFVPVIDGAGDTEIVPIPGKNPKIDALVDFVADLQGKVIVWSRFRPEGAAAARALRKVYGDAAVVEFHGDVNDDDRLARRQAFQDPNSPVRFFVGQTDTGKEGIDLSQARTLIYLSNSFALDPRLQSEDRASSAAQKHSVTVVDIVAKGSGDWKVVEALRARKNIAREVTGDKQTEWI